VAEAIVTDASVTETIVTDAPVQTDWQLTELTAFLVAEARLADESRYDEWEALWDDDGVYWVPTGDNTDPARQVSFIFDNRRRIASRISQLRTGKRHSQVPPSKMRRLLSNVEIIAEHGAEVEVAANFALFEHRYATTIWAGRALWRIRRTDAGLRMVKKTVLLINNENAIKTIAFLL
jgi:3-phenylpropionate/cinnamic acid dioxygenase small subunit